MVYENFSIDSKHNMDCIAASDRSRKNVDKSYQNFKKTSVFVLNALSKFCRMRMNRIDQCMDVLGIRKLADTVSQIENMRGPHRFVVGVRRAKAVQCCTDLG